MPHPTLQGHLPGISIALVDLSFNISFEIRALIQVDCWAQSKRTTVE